MSTSGPCLLIIIVLAALFVIISITLNAATLGIVINRFDQLKKTNDNQEPTTMSTTTNRILLNSSLVEAIRITDVMEHLSQFYRIALTENGTRAINTKGFNRTIDYIADYLSINTNYYINKTYFPIRTFQLASNPILLTSINGVIINRTYSTDLTKAEFFHIQYSTAINLTDFTTLTVIPNGGCLDEDWLSANPSPMGRIVLVKRGLCDFLPKAAFATKYQAKTLLFYNDGTSSDRNNPIFISLDRSNELPALFLSFDLGQELANAFLNSTNNVSVCLIIDLVNIPQFPVANICADTPTGDITQTILVGSHSDSVPDGPGINDNGSGSAANLALAVALFQTSIYTTLKYRIRFCWWGAEEIGLIGSDFYVKQAKLSTIIGERLSDNLVNLNFDMLGSPNYVFGIYNGETITNATPEIAVPGSIKVTSLFRDWFNSQKLPWNNSTLGSGSDYAPFLAAGVAAGGLLSGASGIKTKEQCDRYALLLGPDPYCTPNIAQDPCYHRSCDTIWNINVFAYEKMVKAAGYVIESLARTDNLKEWLYPTQEIQNLKSSRKNKREYNSISEYFGLATV
ncbi:unnamed protein product [Rotaria socialis]|uniref:Peptide hydrolase n=1 Tax=Rotaria socialis TaxID=392032 RepID=A0A820R9Y4_9BILA|nr:unnamed protein product [Rotaria socialis]CAF4435496.1 unnamed protein product [Rotaria socialis]